jgi:pSer/pThr/pTyr-binding forkhead associated (FHA) protein
MDATEFQKACGASGPVRLAVAYPGMQPTERHDIDSPFILIGCHPACDVCLDHEDVDDRHAYLQVVGGQVYCVDLRSRSGTYWESGGEGSGWLDRDETIRIGPYHLWLADSRFGTPNPSTNGHPRCPLQALPREEDTLPGLVLDFQKEGPEALQWRMKQTLVLLGKSGRCKVRVGGPGVLNFHSSLLRTTDGAWIIDLGGGTQVNGAPVRFARLEQGDELRIGDLSMRVRFEESRSLLALPAPRMGSKSQQAKLPIPRRRSPASEIVSQPVPVQQPPGVLPETVLANLALMNPLTPLPPLWQSQGPDQLGRSDPLLLQILSQFGQMQQQMMGQHQQTMTFLCQVLAPLVKDRQGITEEIDRLKQIAEELQEVQAQLAKTPAPPPVEPAPSVPSAKATVSEAPPPPPERKPAVPSGEPVFNHSQPPDPGDERPHTWLMERMVALQNEQQTRWQRLLKQVRAAILGAKE